jgi:hypothetical protein
MNTRDLIRPLKPCQENNQTMEDLGVEIHLTKESQVP